MSETYHDQDRCKNRCDGPQQKFLDAAVAVLLLCGFFHVTEVAVHRDEIDLRLELENCRSDRETEGCGA